MWTSSLLLTSAGHIAGHSAPRHQGGFGLDCPLTSFKVVPMQRGTVVTPYVKQALAVRRATAVPEKLSANILSRHKLAGKSTLKRLLISANFGPGHQHLFLACGALLL